jgi:hypothetical protein
MIQAIEERIIVRVNEDQKDSLVAGGNHYSVAIKYATNHREKNPVLCEVVEGYGMIDKGTVLICHHNHFGTDSPYYYEDDLYSIPFNKNIFCVLDERGLPAPVCGNLVGRTLGKHLPGDFSFAPSHKKQDCIDRVQIAIGAFGFSEGQVAFTYPYSPYEVVYNYNGEERRFFKIHKEDIVARM